MREGAATTGETVVTFEQFRLELAKVNARIEISDARTFFDKYFAWTDYHPFLISILRRTKLPLAVVLDCETAFQNLMCELGRIERSDAVVFAEWNNILKLAEERVGADAFDISVHGNPKYIFSKIIRRRDFDKIVEKIYGS